jgi:hypothetical protein
VGCEAAGLGRLVREKARRKKLPKVPTMVGPTLTTWRSLGLALAIAAAVGYGLSLRLEDPLSTPVIPAEDPYTHMALVREHLRDGTIHPLNPSGALYPPGMHALMAATLAYTGVDLYDLTRAGPAFLGALGLLGIGILLARHESLGAGVAGALALAIMPEAIFRTTMMSPTAVDLALLPFLALAIIETLQGRLAWAAPTAALAGFLLFSHPWVFGVLGVAGLGVILFSVLLPWPERRGPPVQPWGFVAVLAIVGTGVALSLNGCWGACGPGFRDVLGEGASTVVELSYAVLAASLLPLVVKAVRPKAFTVMFPATRPPSPFAARLIMSQALLITVVFITYLSSQGPPPPFVHLPRMIGTPLLYLGALGLVLLPFRPTPAGHVGAGLALGTYPFVVFNPFDSPFWSHRTAVYLCIGVALLVGVACSALVQGLLALSRRLPSMMAAGPPGARPSRVGVGPLVAVSGMLLLAFLGTGVVASTPGQYPGGWYRLYPECEFEGLREVGALAAEDPRLLVITATWQSKLVLSSFADENNRLWYKPDFFSDHQERAKVVQMLEQDGRPLVVLADSRLAAEHPEIEPSFLDDAPWTGVGSWCPPAPQANLPDGAEAPPLRAYTLE